MARLKSWNNRFDVINELGKGGNAIVYHVREKSTGEEFALKELYNGGKEKQGRFIDEINILVQNCRIVVGIIPIIESSIEEYWYTMPIAQPILQHIKSSDASSEDIIRGLIQLSETLSILHAKQIYHRDIKPSNIYFYNGRYCLGDFGLVDFPDNPNDFTKSDKGLGAIFTIAPEMKRDPKNSDGKKADVFSLAKTLWMLLSGDERGFDGVYDFLDKSHSLRFIEKYREIHTVELDELLMNATNNNPTLRHDIDSFKQQLELWLDILGDFEYSQASDWNFLNKYLFGDTPPESTVWRDTRKIINVLNIIGTLPAYNHMLFSDEGGLDFKNAELANENGCIYIYDSLGYCFLLKPKCLYFEGFNENYSWNYFLLELDELSPVFNSNSLNYELLVEDFPANYVSAQYAQYGVYDYERGDTFPSGYKVVHRYLNGKFLIVLGNGPYNKISATYDGRHGLCSNSEFRSYIEYLIKISNTLKSIGYDEDRIFNSQQFSENPFDRAEDNDLDRIKKQLNEYKNPVQYITDNFGRWCFKEMLPNNFRTGNIAFYITFEKGHISHRSLLTDENLYLCIDGKIKKLKDKNLHEVYYVYNRDEAIKLKNRCMEFVNQNCIENHFDEPRVYEQFFSIKLKRVGKPTHLFSRSEIEKSMRNADDRKHNMLVIDEDGYAKVIEDMDYRFLYPVRHESWNAGNMYVGKYSRLDTLEDDYISSLQGWLIYLKSGRTVYMDYIHENANEEELLNEIKKYY